MTKLIIGLGNPGDKYQYNRHNAGFIIINAILGPVTWKEKPQWQAKIFEQTDKGDKTIFALPQTYMNLSGQAVLALKNFYKIENADITLIHDDIDLLFGNIRHKKDGGSAGHNGVKSVIDYIGDDFNRIRIGIKNELADIVETDRFVLSNFSKEEYEILISNLVKETLLYLK